MEQGPVLIITFQTQQIMSVRDAKGKVVEGDPVCFLSFYPAFILMITYTSTGKNLQSSLRLGAVS